MRTLATANQKGGTGKTTTTVNLSAALAEQGRRVLVIDLDPQGHTSRWYGIPRDDDRGLFDVITGNSRITDIIRDTAIDRIAIVPSSRWLVGAERALAGEVGAETILRRCIGDLPDKWDYLILDCPPNLGILTVNALAAVDELIVPVESRVLALEGLQQLGQTVEAVRERLNPKLRIAGIVPCRVDTRTRHSPEVVAELRTRFSNVVYNTAIRENIRIAECPSFGVPITQYDTRSMGASDYRSLALEVLAQEGESNGSASAEHDRD